MTATMERGSTFASLKVRNFRLFFTGQIISQVGNWLTLIAQTLLVYKITNSGVALGVLTASQFLPNLLLGPWAGVIADRRDKRRLLLTVQSIAMLQSFVLAGVAFSDHPSVVAICIVASCGGVANAFDNPARRSFVVEMVPVDQTQNAVSLNSALMTGSRVVGPALAGFLIHKVGFGWCFVVDGVSYFAVLLGLFLIRVTELRPMEMLAKGKGQILSGVRYARREPDLWVPLVMMAIVGTFTFNFNVVMPLLLKRTFHGGDTLFTNFYAVLSIGSVVGALVAARRTGIESRHMVWSSAAFGVAMAALALSPNAAVAFPIGFLVGVTSISFMTTSTTLIQLRSDPAMRGRVLSLQAMVFLGSTPIGGPIVGTISQWLNPRVGVAVGAAAALIAAFYGWRSSVTGRRF